MSKLKYNTKVLNEESYEWVIELFWLFLKDDKISYPIINVFQTKNAEAEIHVSTIIKESKQSKLKVDGMLTKLRKFGVIVQLTTNTYKFNRVHFELMEYSIKLLQLHKEKDVNIKAKTK